MEDNRNTKNDMNTLIGNTLRIGVFTACIIALIGGIWYVVVLRDQHYQIIKFSLKEPKVIQLLKESLNPYLRCQLQVGYN